MLSNEEFDAKDRRAEALGKILNPQEKKIISFLDVIIVQRKKFIKTGSY